MSASSPHFAVASLFSLRVALLAPTTDAQITHIEPRIWQQFSVDHTKEGGPSRIVTPPAVAHSCTPAGPPAFGRNSSRSQSRSASRQGSRANSRANSPSRLVPGRSELNRSRAPHRQDSGYDPTLAAEFPPVEAEEEWRMSRVYRVPMDDYVRSSTLDGSKARIRVAHKLLILIRYRVASKPDEQQIEVSRPVTIDACCTLHFQNRLPSYSSNETTTVTKTELCDCTCKLRTEEIMDDIGELLENAGDIDEPDDSFVLGVEERESKTPAYTSSAMYQ